MTLRGIAAVARHSSNAYTSTRPTILGLTKVIVLGLSQLSTTSAGPLKRHLVITGDEVPETEDASLWLYLTTALILVLLGGAFAGLTIALMGQDGIYLQVIATSGEGKEQRHAQKVYRLLKRGKHWVLVALLLSNVIVNETLPIVLDRSLGGGWPAVLGSTVLIVIFGEIIPQSVCVRYGLQIGAFMSPFVLVLMYLLAPIAWPTAKLLDWLLGEDEGTVYKKSGLKTLVTLHKTLGSSPSERLNQDEVTIISAVLDLKDKPVGDIMTPMEDVFTMSADTVLDEKTMDIILSAGYSRIPIYEPNNENNFVGMLLVKILITYDPEDCKRVSDFALATLPETRPETSCLDIVNFFQEGKSHMVLVSEYPGEDRGAIGVVTLEDVIEELIGEEIIDESDVYIDVHKAIRRMAPAPKARVPKGHIITDPENLAIPEDNLVDIDGGEAPDGKQRDRVGSFGNKGPSPAVLGSSPKTTFIMRRSSGAQDGSNNIPVAVRGNANDMREHLKHLGPSNLASRPKSTKYNTVKIKRATTLADLDAPGRYSSIAEEPYRDNLGLEAGEGEGLLKSAGKEASDGVQAVQRGYGSIENRSLQSPGPYQNSEANYDGASGNRGSSAQLLLVNPGDSDDSDTMGSLPSRNSSPLPRKRNPARSGSITENIVDAGGVRKVVLETNSSSDDPDAESKRDGISYGKNHSQTSLNGQSENRTGIIDDAAQSEHVKKKNKRRRKRKGATKGEDPAMPGSSAN